MRRIDLHLVSDATGETIRAVTRACLVQFEGVEPIEHLWPMVRNTRQIDEVIAGVSRHPGPVFFTIVDDQLRTRLLDGCRGSGAPCVSVLDPVMAAFGSYLGAKKLSQPGLQHLLDAQYFERIEAMHFVLSHDDGQALDSVSEADVVLVGVSRTSKTPTCIYLANRGIKAANVPLVPGMPLPPELLRATRALVVGLTTDPARLVQIRRNRLLSLNQSDDTEYVDPNAVRDEVAAARRLCAQQGWPVLDVTRRSIEETATAVMQLYAKRTEGET